MLVNKWDYKETVARLENVLFKNESTWLNRFSNYITWNDIDPSVSIDDYVQWLASKNFASFKQELGFLLKFLGEIQTISPFVRRYLFRLQSNIVVRRKQQIPTSSMIEAVLPKLNLHEKIFLLVLSSCGRRSIDLTRFTSRNLKIKQDTFHVRLERDKSNSNPIRFAFVWDSTIHVDWKFYDKAFRNLLDLKQCPFQKISVQRIRRKAKEVGFHLHGTRNRKALQLIQNGVPMEQVKQIIGWSADESLERYSKLTAFDICNFANLDEAIKFINK